MLEEVEIECFEMIDQCIPEKILIPVYFAAFDIKRILYAFLWLFIFLVCVCSESNDFFMAFTQLCNISDFSPNMDFNSIRY